MLPHRFPTAGPILALVVQLFFLACANKRADIATALANRPDLRADYRVLAVRCSKCHSLARPLNSGITDDNHWDQYVARMRRQPSSGINQGDAVAILRFLHALAAAERERLGASNDIAPLMTAADGGNP